MGDPDKTKAYLAHKYDAYICEVILRMNESWITDSLLRDACVGVVCRVAKDLGEGRCWDDLEAKKLVHQYAELTSVQLSRMRPQIKHVARNSRRR